ncbi:Receptor-type guanylate cyclase gcy [Seminavis robusta]|uniref:Receptor-type guanylate cyclase gcy n=1 Tax=Seminavis robusta TaxID=568900 RepID=A0A9N8HHM7_9STRA|nr:Receptor-type guanylate cyclase gcy [Seminavis robusta]|eukprot:Sro647_g180890.1 Receptor-type guanylate cyclase gcy (788) ;mRNA; f:22004-24957
MLAPQVEEESGFLDESHSMASHAAANRHSLDERVSIGTKESKAVCRMRMLLILVLVSVATLVSVGVFWYIRNKELEDFETEYYHHAHKLTTAFRANAARRVAAVESFATSITSLAKQADMTWPNVTIQDYEARASYVLELAAVMSIIFLPVVTNETREGWEAYSKETQGWLNASLAYQEPRLPADLNMTEQQLNLKAIEAPPIGIVEGPEIRPFIFQFNITDGWQRDPGPGPIYVPWWQWSPVFPTRSLQNYDTLSHPFRRVHVTAALRTKEPLINRATNFGEIEERGKMAALNLWLARRTGARDFKYEKGPVSDLYVPVFKDIDVDPNSTKNDREVGGLLTSYVWWQIYFQDILPENAQGVMAILENTCNQTYSYLIHGEEPHFIGAGDLHDTKYDDFVVSTGYNAFLGGSANPHDLEPGQCSYQVRVYPTQELEDTFTSNNPLYFTLLVLSVFLFTSLVFIVYDAVVEKRQTVVLKQAVQSTEVVQQLFPSTVRDRLFEEEKEKAPDLDKLMSSGELEGIDEKTAIANLHHNCTVLFADLAGFTKWSSSRDPKHVFTLLETLYGLFDKTAKRRGVFKVETIGDCYLAVTGIPRPQKDHAKIMVRFAAECMEAMNQVIHAKLLRTLGEDTADLQMRVGLHSGSVTAGVLRGDRARFQLFGDTVNTASRMESNGLPGKIQASADTADVLRAGGKGAWLTERAGGVEAKGKGRVRTFWVSPAVDPGTSGSVSTFHTNMQAPTSTASGVSATSGMSTASDHSGDQSGVPSNVGANVNVNDSSEKSGFEC